MKNSTCQKIKLFCIILSLPTTYAFSQEYFFPSVSVDSRNSIFKYGENYYDISTKGFSSFIEETQMREDLKVHLSHQVKRIKAKKTASQIVFWGSFAAGAGIMVNEAIATEDNEQMNTGTLATGVGVFLVGGLINWMVGPKKKDYYNFINTFNKGESDEKIKIVLKIDFQENLNYGIAISF